MHILFAEDSKTVAMHVTRFLEHQGHRVTHVTDGLAAVAAFEAERPDLALLDVVMPELDGIEATRRLKAIAGSRWVPVLLMTGLSSADEIIAGFESGADDYLVKPINLAILAARLRSMERIFTMQSSLYGILDNVYEGIITINSVGIVESYNPAAERIFGYRATQVIGRNVKMLMPSPYTEQHDGYLARYMRERTPRVMGVGRKVQGRRKNGQIFPMRLSITEIQKNSGSLFIGLVSDISEEEKARERIEFLALHDPLTSLPNRAHFNEFIAVKLQEHDLQHAVLFIDLDGFKPINDMLGHDAGDEALKAVAARLRHNLAANDFAARLGGDEFVVIACNVDKRESVEKIGQRLIDAISEPMTLAGQPARLGASIGVAMFPEHGTTPSEILSAADQAMYSAKRSGKGRVTFAAARPLHD